MSAVSRVVLKRLVVVARVASSIRVGGALLCLLLFLNVLVCRQGKRCWRALASAGAAGHSGYCWMAPDGRASPSASPAAAGAACTGAPTTGASDLKVRIASSCCARRCSSRLSCCCQSSLTCGGAAALEWVAAGSAAAGRQEAAAARRRRRRQCWQALAPCLLRQLGHVERDGLRGEADHRPERFKQPA